MAAAKGLGFGVEWMEWCAKERWFVHSVTPVRKYQLHDAQVQCESPVNQMVELKDTDIPALVQQINLVLPRVEGLLHIHKVNQNRNHEPTTKIHISHADPGVVRHRQPCAPGTRWSDDQRSG